MSRDLRPVATIEDGPEGLTVWVDYPDAGVDRPRSRGWGCRDAKTARRLAAAVDAGVAIVNPTVQTDVNGKTYVSDVSNVLGRVMRADLKRLGF